MDGGLAGDGAPAEHLARKSAALGQPGLQVGVCRGTIILLIGVGDVEPGPVVVAFEGADNEAVALGIGRLERAPRWIEERIPEARVSVDLPAFGRRAAGSMTGADVGSAAGVARKLGWHSLRNSAHSSHSLLSGKTQIPACPPEASVRISSLPPFPSQ